MNIPLEDNFTDVISKAQRGLEISDSELAEQAGLDAAAIRKLRGGNFDEPVVVRIAPVLDLNAQALADLAQNKYRPDVDEIEGLATFNTTYHDMTVNAFLIWDLKSREAIAFDTGADCHPMIDRVKKEKLTVKLVLLTHAHPDHIADVTRLKKETGAPVYISEREPTSGAGTIADGHQFNVGALKVKAFLTWGHSPGGMTFFVTGLARPVAVVGDSIFAGSMGGGNVSYQDAVKNNVEKILTLPDETIICPGHGPLTTVGEEKKHNPFFAGRV
jgi:hydroxyacylglutathione hydrolase